MSPTYLFQTTVQLADIVTRRFEELGRHEDYPVVHKTAVEKGNGKLRTCLRQIDDPLGNGSNDEMNSIQVV